MIEKLLELHTRRAEVKRLKERKTELERQLAATELAIALTDMGDFLRAESEAVAILETEIKSAGVAEYEILGTQPLWPGVKVKLFSVYDYDEAEAIDWCFAKAKGLLRLDKGFVKAALPMGAPIRTLKEPRAQIDTDLSVALNEWLE